MCCCAIADGVYVLRGRCREPCLAPGPWALALAPFSLQQYSPSSAAQIRPSPTSLVSPSLLSRFRSLSAVQHSCSPFTHPPPAESRYLCCILRSRIEFSIEACWIVLAILQQSL